MTIAAAATSAATPSCRRSAGRSLGHRWLFVRRGGGRLFGRRGRCIRFRRRNMIGFGRSCYFCFGRKRGNFRGNRCTKPGSGFLCLRLPVCAAETFDGGQVPLAGVIPIVHGLKVARQFKGDHGVARFCKKRGKLARRIFAGACSADSCCDLLPVAHKLIAF